MRILAYTEGGRMVLMGPLLGKSWLSDCNYVTSEGHKRSVGGAVGRNTRGSYQVSP